MSKYQEMSLFWHSPTPRLPRLQGASRMLQQIDQKEIFHCIFLFQETALLAWDQSMFAERSSTSLYLCLRSDLVGLLFGMKEEDLHPGVHHL